LNLLCNPIILCLFLLYLSLFFIQKLLRHPTGILLCTEKEGPELPHELHCVLLHEPCQLDLNLLSIGFLLLEEAINEVDENFVLEPKELSDPLGNPGLHHVHLYL